MYGGLACVLANSVINILNLCAFSKVIRYLGLSFLI